LIVIQVFNKNLFLKNKKGIPAITNY